MGARDWVVGIEQAWDRVRLHRTGDRTPDDFRIEAYGGHGGAAEGVVVRGRALDDPVPTCGTSSPTSSRACRSA